MDSCRTHNAETSFQKLKLTLIVLLLLFTTAACSHLPQPGALQPEGPGDLTADLPPDNDVPGPVYHKTGRATWYAKRFNGRRTANGEIYRSSGLTAAHKSLPFNTRLLVTNVENGKSVIVRVNDRGPFPRNRIIDLSHEAARRIGIINQGHGMVEVKAISGSDVSPDDNAMVRDDGKGPFSLQAGSFKNRNNAEALVSELENDVQPVNLIEERGYYKVRIGAFHDPADAEGIKESLEEKGYRLMMVKQTAMSTPADSTSGDEQDINE